MAAAEIEEQQSRVTGDERAGCGEVLLVLREAFGLALSEVGAIENFKQRRDSPGFRPPQVPCDYWSSRGTAGRQRDKGEAPSILKSR